MYFRDAAAPKALTFLSAALSLQKVGHPWFRVYKLPDWAVLVIFITMSHSVTQYACMVKPNFRGGDGIF